jgi:hypothetical protein
MVKIIKDKKPKKKYIEVESNETETTETYQTEDGKVFIELRDAYAHESELKLGKAKKVFYWFPMIDDTWYKAKDEEELLFLKNKLAKTYGRRYGEGRLKVGEWFTVVTKDRDGMGNLADHFVPLSKLKDSFYELLHLLEEEDDDK